MTNKNSGLEKELTNHNHDKYITTEELNKLSEETFAARLAETNLIKKKTDFDAKLSSLNRKNVLNKIKHLITETELMKLKTFDCVISLEKVILMKTLHKIT